jgi:predicted transcriptional regulator
VATSTKSDKERVLAIVEDQPDDSTYEEILQELAFARMVDRGLADSDAGRTVSHEELKLRIASWAQSGGPPRPSAGS